MKAILITLAILGILLAMPFTRFETMMFIYYSPIATIVAFTVLCLVMTIVVWIYEKTRRVK